MNHAACRPLAAHRRTGIQDGCAKGGAGRGGGFQWRGVASPWRTATPQARVLPHKGGSRPASRTVRPGSFASYIPPPSRSTLPSVRSTTPATPYTLLAAPYKSRAVQYNLSTAPYTVPAAPCAFPSDRSTLRSVANTLRSALYTLRIRLVHTPIRFVHSRFHAIPRVIRALHALIHRHHASSRFAVLRFPAVHSAPEAGHGDRVPGRPVIDATAAAQRRSRARRSG